MIQVLKSDAFAGPIRPPKTKGISPIFRAKIRVDDDSYRCYVKPLQDSIRCPVTGKEVANHEVISEALGHVLARSAGFSVPDIAGIILLEREQIPADLLPILDSLNSGKPQTDYFCWFSRDMEFPSLKQKHLSGLNIKSLEERRLKRLALKLAANPDSPKVAALDHWLQNSDRNVGNLLASGPDSLMLIDHGRILVYPNWLPGGVGSQPGPSVNKLIALIDHYSSRWSETLPSKGARILAYNGFAVSFREAGENAAREVLSEFFEHIDCDAIIQVLEDRLDPVPYTKQQGMIL